MVNIAIRNVSASDKLPVGDCISFEGACNVDGTFKKGWHPKGQGQWFVKHLGTGFYRVYHNLNTTDYAASFRIVKDVGAIEIIAMSDIHIDILVSKDTLPADKDFHFNVSMVANNA